MNRSEFHRFFGTDGPVILPVIHVLDHQQTAANIDILIDSEVPGCFLINHDFDVEQFLPIIRSIREQYPDFWIGLNFLAVTGRDAFPILAALSAQGCRVDAYWADDARIEERGDMSTYGQTEANAIDQTRRTSGWDGLYFGGTAFKKQREVHVKNYAKAALIAAHYMDAVTTSGIATGSAADISKITAFRTALPDTPIAVASGITPENAIDYVMVDCFMVATGINITDDFYTVDPNKLRLLQTACRRIMECNVGGVE